MNLKKNNYFIWASDCYANTGEGKLAINFIKKLSFLRNHKFRIKTPGLEFKSLNYFKKRITRHNFYKSNSSFIYRYTIFILGILNLWINYFSGKKVIYLNYLPLWNFLIFFLSPPGTIFGPITGTLYKENRRNHFINIVRKYVFPIFFKISIFFLILRNSKYFFSTSQLENIIKKQSITYLCNIQLLFLEQSFKKNKKKFDLLIYNRKHENKNNLNFEKILSNKIFTNKKILILGEKISLPKIKNLGFLPNNKVQNYLRKTRYTIIPLKNIYSFFFFDTINSAATPLFSKKLKFNKNIINIKKNNFINLNDPHKFIKSISKILNNKIKTEIPKINKNYLKNLSNNFNIYLKELFKFY